MIKFAVAGNIAAGKSVVEKILSASGFDVVDTDKLAHEELIYAQEDVISEFLECDILDKGRISRKKLGHYVFSDPIARKNLEKIIHPRVEKRIEQFFEGNKSKKCAFVSIPLLYEAKMEKLFDKVLFVAADDDVRLTRLMKRDNLTKEEAIARIKSQISQDEKMSKADYVIYNNSDIQDVKEQLFKILY